MLIGWPEGDAEPLKYWLSTLSPDRPLHDLVATAKLRWRIERDYREFKHKLGLGHYEGRGWRGLPLRDARRRAYLSWSSDQVEAVGGDDHALTLQ